MANGIDAIIARIESDTGEYIAKMSVEHAGKLQEIEKEKNEKISEIKSEAEKTVNSEREAAKESVTRRADAASRDMLLSEKTRLVDEVFTKAEEKINNLDEKEYVSFFSPMLKKACLGSGVELKDIKVIFPSKGRVEADKIVSSSGLKVSFEETGKFEGGFIVSTEEFELDCTTHTLIYNNRERLESRVTSVLFA